MAEYTAHIEVDRGIVYPPPPPDEFREASTSVARSGDVPDERPQVRHQLIKAKAAERASHKDMAGPMGMM